MKVRAVSKDVGIPPRKVRLVADMIRGKKVDEALVILAFSQTRSVKAVAKTVKSAAANAENTFQMLPSALRITDIFIDEGRTLKRFRAQARGRVSPILKRSAHITVFVSEEEN